MKLLLAVSPFLAQAASPPSGVVVDPDEFTYQFSPFGDYCLVMNYAPDAAELTQQGKAVNMGGNGMSTMKQCADECTAKAGCSSWSYIDNGSGNHECWDTTDVAPDASKPGVMPLVPTASSFTGLAGKCSCPQDGPGTVLDDSTFPPALIGDYAALFPGSDHPPAPMACWPKSSVGVLKNAPTTVQRSSSVLPSDPIYFHGWCKGLTGPVTVPVGSDCKSMCQSDPQCNGFQEVPTAGAHRAQGCYQGAGFDCDADKSPDNGMKSERYERGYISKIATLTKQQIIGLKLRFVSTTYTTTAAPAQQGAAPAVAPDWNYIIKRCQEVCYSDLWCSAWQVIDASATAADPAGCYTESQSNGLPYPLTKSNVVDVSGTANAIRGGEFIQHWYSEDWTTTTTTTTAPAQSNLLPILAGLGALGALLGLLAYAMGWCSPKQPKKRAKRALQPEPVKEEPLPTHPSFLMEAPVLTYTTAPVTYAPPIATQAPVYAAAPVTTASYHVVPHSTSVVVPHSTSVVVPQEPLIHTGFIG